MHYYLGVTQVIQHPVNGTFCEGTTATLSCVIFDNSSTNVANTTSWLNVNTGATVLSANVNNTRNGDVVTSILTFKSVSLSDNGTYLCEPRRNVESYFGMILVKSEYIVCMHEYLMHIRMYIHMCTMPLIYHSMNYCGNSVIYAVELSWHLRKTIL